jgi:hypothetical protein
MKLIGIFATTILIACTGNLFAQGSWNLRYLPIDSLNHSFLNREIRIDFKASDQDDKAEKSIRRLLVKKDTVSLELDHERKQFIESWKIYVDHGVLSDQTLRGIPKDGERSEIVKEIFIRAMDESTLTLEMFLYESNTPKNLAQKRTVVVKRSLVKGILITLPL